MSTRIIHSDSEAATENAAFELARSLPPGATVLLEGDLGAGKTVFARGFARGLGITEAVSSPTYTIMQEYLLPSGVGHLYHLDLYRIANEAAALAFGVDEYLDDPDSYNLLEWPARIAGILPRENVTRVTFRHTGVNSRDLMVESVPAV